MAMPRKQPGPPCVVCGQSSVAQRLCATHYKRFQRHGHLDQTRPTDWGQKTRHPLNETWHHTRRGMRDSRWNDFWVFVSDVGARPSEKHRLCRRDDSRPFGPDNWYWEEPVDPDAGHQTKAERAAYAKAWRAKNPLLAKSLYLKRYGMTLADYDALLEKQNGCCAICKQKDQWFCLAVDHCHITNRVRGLLCSLCNRGIGLFRDSPEFLERAAQYLRWPTSLI